MKDGNKDSQIPKKSENKDLGIPKIEERHVKVTMSGKEDDKWSKEEIEKVEKEVNDGNVHWLLDFEEEHSEEEVVHDEDGEVMLPESGKFPKSVHFVEGDKLDPYELGRVVYPYIWEVKVKDTKMKAEVVKELVEKMNEEARKCGCKCTVLTVALKGMTDGMSEEDMNTAVVQGLRTLSTNVPKLHKEMKGVVEEVEACLENVSGWKKENLSKTARVLKALEEDHERIKKGAKETEKEEGAESKNWEESGELKEKEDSGEPKKPRRLKHMQGWFPICCALCFRTGRSNQRLCEVGQVCFWRTGETEDAKVKMMCCRIRIHSCLPVTTAFEERFRVVKNSEEEIEESCGVLERAKKVYPSETIIGDTFKNLKTTLDEWSPDLRVAPPGLCVELSLGKDAMQSEKETRRYVYAVNKMNWFNVKVRDVRDAQLKQFFYMGHVLERAPEFMKGSEEYEVPKVRSKWGAHVYMDTSQIMMGCQKLKTRSGSTGEDGGEAEDEETVQHPWHTDGAPVKEDGKMRHLAEAETMKNLMHGMSLMIPIQDERQLKSRNADGRVVTNKWTEGELAMWGHTVEHAGLLFPASHSSLNSVWTFDLKSKIQTKAAHKEDVMIPFIAEEMIKEVNPLMSPWGVEALKAYVEETQAFTQEKFKKAGEEVLRRGNEDVKKTHVETLEASIKELGAMKTEFEDKWEERDTEKELEDDAEAQMEEAEDEMEEESDESDCREEDGGDSEEEKERKEGGKRKRNEEDGKVSRKSKN